MNWRAYTENLRADAVLDAEALVMTKAHVEIWAAVIRKRSQYSKSHIVGIEDLIERWAQEEWGEKTMVRFEPEIFRVVVFDDRRAVPIEANLLSSKAEG